MISARLARTPIQVPPHAPHVQQALPTFIKMLLPHARTAMQDSIHPVAQHHVLTARRARLTWTAIHRLLVTRAVRGRTRLRVLSNAASALRGPLIATLIHQRHAMAEHAQLAALVQQVQHHARCALLVRQTWTVIHRLLATLVVQARTPIQVPPHAPHVQQALPTSTVIHRPRVRLLRRPMYARLGLARQISIAVGSSTRTTFFFC